MALTDGIIGCWSPSIRGSGYLLPDLSGRGNHGTFSGPSISDWQGYVTRGNSGLAIKGNGGTNRIGTALRLPTSSMSYGGWVYPTGITTTIGPNRPFGEADAGSGTAGSSVLMRTTGPFVVLRGGTATDINASYTVANNSWCLVVVVLHTRPEVYVDGVLAGSSSGTTIASWNKGFQLLNDDISQPNGINGAVGEVAVWRRPLTAGEIRDWFRRGNGAIGRELTGQTRRRVYGFVPAGFRAYWARRQSQIIGGGVR